MLPQNTDRGLKGPHHRCTLIYIIHCSWTFLLDSELLRDSTWEIFTFTLWVSTKYLSNWIGCDALPSNPHVFFFLFKSQNQGI